MAKTAEELRAVPTLEQQYFARGKELLGQKAGGLLTCLLRKKGGDLALARAVLEMSATKQDPREYVSRVTGPKNPGRLSMDQVNSLKAQAQKQLEQRKNFKPHTAEDKAAVAAIHARFKRAMEQYPGEAKSEHARHLQAVDLGAKADALMRRTLDDLDREFG